MNIIFTCNPTIGILGLYFFKLGCSILLTGSYREIRNQNVGMVRYP